MARFYIATRLSRHLEHNAVRDILVAAGHEITYDWTSHGSVKEVSGERLREVSEAEFDGVRRADFVVSLLRGGRGTHAELGAAAVLHKPTFLHAFPGDKLLFHNCSETCMAYWPGTTQRFIGADIVEFAKYVLTAWDELNSKTINDEPVPPHLAHLVEIEVCDDCPIGNRDPSADEHDPEKPTCRRAALCDWEIGQEMASCD